MNLQIVRRLGVMAGAAGALIVGGATIAAAQSTLTLNQSNATTLRGGTYASTNFSGKTVTETRASSDASYVRRVLLKFDTHTTLPQGTPISKATLTVTVAGGNSQTRSLSAYHETSSYDESVVTWRQRKAGIGWSLQGGDVGARYDVRSITGTVGSKVTFDVTALVQAVVRGDFSATSRYTRIELIDEGSHTVDSYKQIYSDEASDPSVRPTLAITYGTTTAPTPAPVPSTTSTTLRVLQWNTHHGGYGTDGKYDPDRVATWIVRMKPDIISLNEIEYYTGYGNEDQPARYAAMLKAKTGMTWYYKFATASGAAKGNGNLILSRFPLASANSYLLSYTRSISHVTVLVNGRLINFFSTHLDADSTSRRLTEVGQLKTWGNAIAQQRIFAGDFNAWPGTTEIANMTADYYDSWAEAKKAGTAIAYSGNEAGNTRNSRIDYIFYSHAASLLVLKSSQVYDTRDANGIMPSDHRPVLTTFQVK